MCVSRCAGLTDDRHPGVSTGEGSAVHLFMPGEHAGFSLVHKFQGNIENKCQPHPLTSSPSHPLTFSPPHALTFSTSHLLTPHPLTLVSPVVQDKPAVLSLQNLIVRDIANQERGMFLIIDSAPPVMYEFHATSKDTKNMWMRQIQHAVSR